MAGFEQAEPQGIDGGDDTESDPDAWRHEVTRHNGDGDEHCDLGDESCRIVEPVR